MRVSLFIMSGWNRRQALPAAAAVWITAVLDAMLDLLLATVIRCDEIAWQFLGLSMAGWNMIFSLAQAGLAGKMLLRLNKCAREYCIFKILAWLAFAFTARYLI